MGKMAKTSFNEYVERASDLLKIIDINVCGLISILVCGGLHYFRTFTDGLTRYGYIYLMRQQSKIFEKLLEFQNEAKNYRSKKIKFL
jgi:hypothetical protein